MADRAERIQNLKQRMVAKYGTNLIALDVDPASLPVIKKTDSPQERQEKQRLIDEAREAAHKLKLPEMMAELDKIVIRIKQTVSEHKKATGVQGIRSTSTAALSLFTIACEQCGNRDPNNVITDGRRGDRICAGRDGRGCGAVLQDHIEVQGADRRNFEGEDDKRQFGPAPNKLFGDAANMETSLNIEVRGGGGRETTGGKRLEQTSRTVELNLSSVGKEEKHTREGYKTGHKRRAFVALEEIADNLNLHVQVVARAKEEFALYRDIMEAVHQYEGVLLACLVIAFEEVTATSSLYERIEQKFVPLSEGGADDAHAFGHVRPRAEVTEDAAVCAVPTVAMGKFTMGQVREWLMAVATKGMVNGTAHGSAGASASTIAGAHTTSVTATTTSSNGYNQNPTAALASHADYTAEAEIVFRHIAKLESEAEAAAAVVQATRAKRELPKSAIFGTVTKSDRLKRYSTASTGVTAAAGAGASAGGSADNIGGAKPKAGLHLLRVQNITAALHPPAGSSADEIGRSAEAEKWFREAVIRRSLYDATLKEYERVQVLQQTRMRTEDVLTTNMQAAVLAPPLKRQRLEAGSTVSLAPSRTSGSSIATEGIIAPAVQISVPPVSSAVPQDTVGESLEIDLEELVGGPVASASSSRFATLSKSNGGSGGPATSAGAGGGVAVKLEPGIATRVKVEATVGSNAIGGGNTTGTVGAVPPATTAAAGAAGGVKKVGMKPRPKIVIT